MGKDIEILEDYIKTLKLTPEELLKNNEIIKLIEYKEIQAIENLINRVKELEEKDELVKYCRGTLPKDTIAIMMCNDDFCRNFGNDFIPKSKIKEKIEELEKLEKGFHFTGLITECETKIEVLQELLEGQKKAREL